MKNGNFGKYSIKDIPASLGFGTAYCLTGGVLGDASVLAKVTGYRLSVKVLGAVAVAAGAPLANAAAVGFVGDGRLAPQHEAVVIAMSVFAATNILLSKDQAQQVCMIVSEEGAQAEGVSVEKVGKFVEGLFRQAGLGFDAPELPFIAANEIRKFTEGLNEATANDILQSVVNKCKVSIRLRRKHPVPARGLTKGTQLVLTLPVP